MEELLGLLRVNNNRRLEEGGIARHLLLNDLGFGQVEAYQEMRIRGKRKKWEKSYWGGGEAGEERILYNQ